LKSLTNVIGEADNPHQIFQEIYRSVVMQIAAQLFSEVAGRVPVGTEHLF